MKNILLLTVILSLAACQKNTPPDLIILTGSIYTAAEYQDSISAIAVKDGLISAIGMKEDLLGAKGELTQVIDASTSFVMPGIIEGHGHFSNLGNSIRNLNFLKDTSWADIQAKVVAKAQSTNPGEWIIGRGWHQEKWRSQPEDHVGEYPKHYNLSDLTPDNPVMLIHASGHSLFANKKAMEKASIGVETPDPAGGHIVRDEIGRPAGIFEERAMTQIRDAYNDYLADLDQSELLKQWHESIELAQKECLENGITSFQDAGSSFEELEEYEKLAIDGKLDVRLWVMLRHSSEEMEGKIKPVRKIGVGNHFYTCRAIKSEIDGALGSYGAWLIKPYNDKPDFFGQNTTTIEEVEKIAKMSFDNDMQLCVHAIGDRANKELLDIIEEYQSATDENLRWRVEHAQHLDPNDINRFKSTGAIASMQAVHCTSDAPFVVKRLGEWRARTGAYAWKSLLEKDVIIVNGTDTPVEDIDPVANFYASVTRSRLDNGMRFFVDQRMTREQALKSYTLDAAYGAFEEDIKGSIEVGKLADFTILDTDWLHCDDDEIPMTKILYTIVNGEIKYQNKNQD